MPFVSSVVDEAGGRLRVTVVQRGGRTVERLQALMGRERVEIRLPGEVDAIAGRPVAVDVAATGNGPQPLFRVDLTLAIGTGITEAGADGAATAPSLAERLARVEAKLDRVIAILERDTSGA